MVTITPYLDVQRTSVFHITTWKDLLKWSFWGHALILKKFLDLIFCRFDYLWIWSGDLTNKITIRRLKRCFIFLSWLMALKIFSHHARVYVLQPLHITAKNDKYCLTAKIVKLINIWYNFIKMVIKLLLEKN